MLENTTVILHARNVLEPTLSQLKQFVPEEKIFIYDDFSMTPITNAKYRSEKFTGRYDHSMNVLLPLIGTKYVVRINGGDEVYDLKEPVTGKVWLSKIQGDPDHQMDPSRYPNNSTSIISGSVIDRNLYATLLNEYNFSDKKILFGAFCGSRLLSLPDLERAEEFSLKFTRRLWR